MRSNKSGFSLVEVLIVTVITLVVIVGLIEIFIYSTKLAGISRNLTVAMSEARTKMEEIRNTSFSSIVANYSSGGTPGNTFSLTNLTGKGVIYIDSTNAPANSNLLKVEIVVCWRENDGRIIGEDQNLDGNLVVSEDTNGDNKINSMATLISMIARH